MANPPPVIRAVARNARASGGPAALGITRRGLVNRAWSDVYHALLVMSWPRFFGVMVGMYVGLNLLFGALYWLGGDCIAGAHRGSWWDALMFSVQTIATIGYGVLSPKTKYADV